MTMDKEKEVLSDVHLSSSVSDGKWLSDDFMLSEVIKIKVIGFTGLLNSK